jgi:hypothetical protein
MLDTCLVNSYLIWRGDSTDSGQRAHRQFREAVYKALRNTPYLEDDQTTNKRRRGNSLPSLNQQALIHNWVQLQTRSYCVWRRNHAEKWAPKRARPVLAELVNGEQSAQRKRTSRSQYGCDSCNVYLYRKGSCWSDFHSQNNNK